MRIEARGIDPVTGEPDPHGIPQIPCPARGDDVHPQFTCLTCPCAAFLETHDAVDDLGLPFQMVDAVECTFREEETVLPISQLPFPVRVSSASRESSRVAPAVACPLLEAPERIAPLAVEVDGRRWVNVSSCASCQFYRGLRGESAGAADGGQYVLCTASGNSIS